VSKQIFDKLESEIAPILEAVVERAKAGSGQDARFLLTLFVPKAKQNSADLGTDIPALETADDLAAAHAQIIGAVTSGKIDADAGHSISALLESQRRHIETVQLSRKLERLERGAAPVIEIAPIREIGEDDALSASKS
jgi:hypothetical protein